jgi:predicted transcriptional regulator of viral defense system
MKGYKELSEKVIFTFDDALDVFKHKPTAYAALRRLNQKGFLMKIRNNLYSCINPITKSVYADKFQIASSINEKCYISHHSAFEYYGYQNQVYNTVFVSSEKRFNTFEFDGITYQYVKSNSFDGVLEPPYTYKIIITDIERTIVDSINQIDSISNLEELINNISLVPSINPEKLVKYLEIYNLQVLYQKAAYILSLFQDNLKLNHLLFDQLKMKINKSVGYLNEEAKLDGVYISEYQLVVPKWLSQRGQDHEI